MSEETLKMLTKQARANGGLKMLLWLLPHLPCDISSEALDKINEITKEEA